MVRTTCLLVILLSWGCAGQSTKSGSPKPTSSSEAQTQNPPSAAATDTVRQILAPCNTESWREDTEFAETLSYLKQNFSLVSGTPLVPDASGKYAGYPDERYQPAAGSCHWTFARNPVSAPAALAGIPAKDTVRQIMAPCNAESWKADTEFSETQLYFKQGFSLVAGIPLIADASGKYPDYPDAQYQPALGSCYWIYARNPH